ncbi:hypothetical protein K439DRAFT_1325957 [Ramaria rubella]|nr:hypothetical protein K439DRAFT_1325957 [Ramaria rubella]
MHRSTTNGVSLLSESRFSSGATSTYSSSTQGDDHSPTQSPTWQQNVSASFMQLSKQFQAAAQAVSTVPPTSDHALSALLDRLENIEEGQRRLGEEIQSLKDQFEVTRERESAATVVAPEASDLEVSIKEQVELFKLEQERLHGRLHNALATKSLSPIRILPMRNRKTPTNFPSTRGEFEHLTKERYEALMTSYDIPITGDTNAKREALRAFLGIPTNPPEKK